MNRRIAAFTIATVAVLGLTACSGGAAEEPTDSNSTEKSAPADKTSTDQSVADACAAVLPKLTEASSAASNIDPSDATADPQAMVDQFSTVVEGFGDAADSVSNTEVKDATTAVYDNFVALRDVLSAVLIDQNLEAASDMSTIASDITTSATALQELCG